MLAMHKVHPVKILQPHACTVFCDNGPSVVITQPAAIVVLRRSISFISRNTRIRRMVIGLLCDVEERIYRCYRTLPAHRTPKSAYPGEQ